MWYQEADGKGLTSGPERVKKASDGVKDSNDVPCHESPARPGSVSNSVQSLSKEHDDDQHQDAKTSPNSAPQDYGETESHEFGTGSDAESVSLAQPNSLTKSKPANALLMRAMSRLGSTGSDVSSTAMSPLGRRTSSVVDYNEGDRYSSDDEYEDQDFSIRRAGRRCETSSFH